MTYRMQEDQPQDLIDVTRCKPNILDRFWSHVDRSGDCWTWTGYEHASGYGYFCPYQGKNVRAHRFIDFALNGAHLPGEMTLHTCDNPRCVRPSHLFRGTHHDNMRDRSEKQRQARGEGNAGAKLSEAQVLTILDRLNNGDTQRQIAREYGVAKGTIQFIAAGKTWRHLR